MIILWRIRLAEVSEQVVKFLKENIPRGLKWTTYKVATGWYKQEVIADFLEVACKGKSPIIKKRIGKAFGETILVNDVKKSYEYSSVQEAISYIGKVFTKYLRGEKTGIWKTGTISPGYTLMKENSILDSLFVEGILQGFLIGIGAKGGIIRTPKVKEYDDVFFSEYEMIWMKSNLK